MMGEAWVNFRIEASDPIGHGVGEASFTVDLAPMDLDLFPQELYAQAPGRTSTTGTTTPTRPSSA